MQIKLGAFILPVTFFLSSLPASATSVVCIRTPDVLAIAADSRLAARGGELMGNSDRECKIVRSGNTFFSLTGLVRDPARHYNVVKIVRKALDGIPPPRDWAGSVAENVATGLMVELLKLRVEAPELYNKYIKLQKGTLLKVLLAGFEGDKPWMVLLGFRQALSPSGEITVAVEREACPGDCDPAKANMFVLGDRRPIDAYLQNGKVEWHTPEQAARALVEAVITARTPDVGPPVDVLRIDKEGTKWIEKKAECP